MLGALSASLACQGCRAGYFSTEPGLTSASQCTRCAVGKTSDAGATSCGECRPGEFPNELLGACATCPANSEVGLQNVSKPEQCKCLPGYRLGFNARGAGGATSYTGLTRVHTFPAGQSAFTLFLPAIIQALCGDVQVFPPTLLPAGVYPSSESCTETVVVQYPVDVQFDELLTETYAQCIQCVAGTYSLGMMAAGDSCVLCPARSFQDLAGQTACKACATGDPTKTGMPICEPCPGQTVLQDGECRPCPDGTYFTRDYAGTPVCANCPRDMWSDKDSGGCQLCPARSTSAGGTALSGCKCEAGTELKILQGSPYCIQCSKPGTYAPAGANTCLLCGGGTFSTALGASACIACPTNGIASNGATACTGCALSTVPSSDGSRCVPCPAGYYCGVGKVYACPLGTYSIKTGLTKKAQCPNCPANSFCRSPTTIASCPENTWSKPGSVTRHYCICNSGYRCEYSLNTVGSLTVQLTPEQFEAQREAVILALAQAAGVSPSKVKLLGLTPG
jgi:hypothetical protein